MVSLHHSVIMCLLIEDIRSLIFGVFTDCVIVVIMQLYLVLFVFSVVLYVLIIKDVYFLSQSLFVHSSFQSKIMLTIFFLRFDLFVGYKFLGFISVKTFIITLKNNSNQNPHFLPSSHFPPTPPNTLPPLPQS